MEAIQMIKERRSVRKFKDEVVSREVMKEIIEVARFAPSWGNFQIARYTIVDDSALIKRLATEGAFAGVYNSGTLLNAKGVAVLTFVKGKSGKTEGPDYLTSKADLWEVFDAGIACQTFVLAAHAKGVGTTIMGIIDDASISEVVGIPEEETVAALIVYGYEEGEHAPATPRMDVDELVRFA